MNHKTMVLKDDNSSTINRKAKIRERKGENGKSRRKEAGEDFLKRGVCAHR